MGSVWSVVLLGALFFLGRVCWGCPAMYQTVTVLLKDRTMLHQIPDESSNRCGKGTLPVATCFSRRRHEQPRRVTQHQVGERFRNIANGGPLR